jgi:glycerol-3-phosphate dehydrogenase
MSTPSTSTAPTSTAWSRAAHRQRLADERFDVLVIGGGVTGAGAALDLSLRGLRVALVEQHDVAQGTSSRSTKLFHGGVRYLPLMQLHLVAEGRREQKVLARIAGHLFDPLEFVIPRYEQYGLASAPGWLSKGRRAQAALWAGLTLYDAMGGRGRPGGRSHGLSGDEIGEMFPLLRTSGLRGGISYFDGQTDDARLVVAVTRSAVRAGAVAVTHLAVSNLTADRGGWRAELRDDLDDTQFTVQARSVLAATGAFKPPGRAAEALPLRLSKGIHLLLDADTVGLTNRALVLPETDDGRVLYIVPWHGTAMVGTTDTIYTGDPLHPNPDPDDVDYLTRHLERYLSVSDPRPITAFGGIRALAGVPGTSTASASTASASREHVVRELAPGYVAVAGGKLTTYRRIAGSAADLIARHLGVDTDPHTDRHVLVGADRSADEVRRTLSPTLGAPVADVLAQRYGSHATDIAALAGDNPTLAQPLADGIVAEVVFAARHEAACTIADVALRRTRLAWLQRDHARSVAPLIADALAVELGWPPGERARQLSAFESDLVAEGL